MTTPTVQVAEQQVFPPAPPTAQQVVLLQAVRDYPAVSVLLNTAPAPVMEPRDVGRLKAMVADAVQRLRSEDLGPKGHAAVASLERLAARAVNGATSTALGLFASTGTSLAVPLPVAVHERVVVDPTFATRDLVRALHRTPRHLVLVLNSGEARLFQGVGDTLRPALRSSFPLKADPPRGDQRSRGREPDSTAFYRKVDAALGTFLRLHPSPLVLVGPDRALAGFRSVSRNLGRLAGTLEGNLAREPLSDLAVRCKPVLERYLLSRQQDALDLLERRASSGRVVSGMISAWLAARRERPEMLAVEEGMFYPARISADGDLLLPATDVEHPEVIDDAVDELIELVLDRGGWIALVEDGVLGAHERVALTLRTRD